MLKYIVALILLFNAFFMLCLCKVAGKADEYTKEIMDGKKEGDEVADESKRISETD